MYLDYRYFDEIAAQTRMGRGGVVPVGRTAVYRRELLLRDQPRLHERDVHGRAVQLGRGQAPDHAHAARGLPDLHAANGPGVVDVPAGRRMFFKQRLRWARNTWRSDLRALGRAGCSATRSSPSPWSTRRCRASPCSSPPCSWRSPWSPATTPSPGSWPCGGWSAGPSSTCPTSSAAGRHPVVAAVHPHHLHRGRPQDRRPAQHPAAALVDPRRRRGRRQGRPHGGHDRPAGGGQRPAPSAAGRCRRRGAGPAAGHRRPGPGPDPAPPAPGRHRGGLRPLEAGEEAQSPTTAARRRRRPRRPPPPGACKDPAARARAGRRQRALRRRERQAGPRGLCTAPHHPDQVHVPEPTTAPS